MGKEIERKFEVVDDGWRGCVESKSVLRQGYLSTHEERTVRVRLTEGRAQLTIKGVTEGVTRDEFEYEVPPDDAEEILHELCLQPIIEKHRHRVPFEGRTWEVDEFFGANEGLVIAEIELESEDEEIHRPDWAGNEVSGDPRFYNANLVAHPFRDW